MASHGWKPAEEEQKGKRRRRMAKLLVAVVVVVLAISLRAYKVSFTKRCRIKPIRVDLGPLPKPEGFWTPEFNVQNVEKIVTGFGPEDVAVDSQGQVYTGTENGWVMRIGLDGTVENHTFVGGQILGLAVGPGDEIYCAVPNKGLLKISKDGVLGHLTNEVDGSEIMFADGVIVAKDGTVYFSDASTKFRMVDHQLDSIEGRRNGRILKYDPSTSSTSVLVKDLGFANGVALSANEDFLLFSETSRARVMRFWLKGEKEGTLETFIDGLPGFPDNVRLSERDGNFYIGLPVKRSKVVDWLFAVPCPWLRLLAVDPTLFRLANLAGGGRLIVVSAEGELVKKYDDPSAKVMTYITGGNLIGEFVYFTTLQNDFIGRLKL